MYLAHSNKFMSFTASKWYIVIIITGGTWTKLVINKVVLLSKHVCEYSIFIGEWIHTEKPLTILGFYLQSKQMSAAIILAFLFLSSTTSSASHLSSQNQH